MNISAEQKQAIIKMQATLAKIANKQPVFFNIAQYTLMGLVKEHGTRNDGTSNWILTAKANAILNVVI
jgi:hypothetical protein